MRTGKHTGVRYFWIGFLISALFMLIGFIVIGVWPAGNGTVLIIDSLHQYLPFYTDFHEKLVSGDSLLYSFSAGLGYNFWATWAYYLASPVNFLLILVPTANVCDFMDLVILLKIGLCGGTFTWYLYSRNRKSGAFPVAFGTMYALSFFLIGYYFNLMWLDSIAMLPLIMKGIEQICGLKAMSQAPSPAGSGSGSPGSWKRGIRDDSSDGRLYGLALFYGLWCNYYIGFMLCIFAVLYFLVCMISAGFSSLKLFFARLFRFGWFSLLAGGMGALVLFPAYRALTISESMQSNKFPTVIKFYDSFLDLVMAHFAGIPPINIANSQVGLNAYCGVSVFLLVILYLLDRRIRLREKAAYFALTAFLVLSFSLNVLNYIWHGFHQQNGIPNRFAFLYVAVILVMCFDASADIPSMALWKILVSGALPVAFTLTVFILKLGENYEGEAYTNETYIITLLLLCIYSGLLLIVRISRMKRELYAFLLSGFLVVEAGAGAVYGIICNDSVTRDIYLKDQASYKSLMAEVGDSSWYRSEVDAQRMRNVTMFCGGKALVMFNSTMQASVTDFCDRLGIEARTNKNGYNGVTELMNDVLGIKYVLSAHGTGSSFYGMEPVTDDGNLTVYRNDDALAIGFLANRELVDWDIEQGTPIEVQNAFVRLATGMEDIFRLDRYISLEEGVSNGIRIPEGKQVYIYLPSRVKEMKLTTPEFTKTYTTYTDHLYSVFSCDGSRDASFTVKLNSSGKKEASVYTCPDAAEKAVIEYLSAHQLENVKAEGNRLSGTIEAPDAAELLITVPYDRNWKCTVDGETVDADPIGSALMGLPLSAGKHEILLTYVPDGMKEGALLSLVCAALYLLSFAAEGRKKRGSARGGKRDERPGEEKARAGKTSAGREGSAAEETEAEELHAGSEDSEAEETDIVERI